MKLSIILTMLLINTSFAFANEDEQTERKYKFSGSGQLGLTSTSGNSETDNITAGLKLVVETGNWISDMNLNILQASSDGIDTADRYTLNTKTGYKFSEKNYFYYGSRYENDNFSGFDYTISSGFGWGHKFTDTDTNRLISEIGIGYKTEALDIDRSETSGVALLGKLDYMRQLTETTSFENLTTLESTDDNTFIQNDAGLSVKISSKFKVKLAHQYRHNTDVPVGFEKTDRLVSANLVYDF
ncbi:MAG: YdiY family protein [Marinicellaceae bacterium]